MDAQAFIGKTGYGIKVGKKMSQAKFVSDIMTHKVQTIESHRSAYDAAETMEKHNVGALIVIDSQGITVGIFTERDLLKRVVAKKLDPEKTKLSEVMTTFFISVQPGHELIDLAKVMVDGNFRHLPVFEGNKLLGILSIKDIIAYLSEKM